MNKPYVATILIIFSLNIFLGNGCNSFTENQNEFSGSSNTLLTSTMTSSPESITEVETKGSIMYQEQGNLWLLDISTKKIKPLVFDKNSGYTILDVAWSPDGLFFVYEKGGKLTLRDIAGTSSRNVAFNAVSTWWVNTETIGYCQDSDNDDKFNNPCFLFNITTNLTTSLQTDNYGQFAYSPDLSKVLVQEFDRSGIYIQPQLNIYLLDLETNDKIFQFETGLWTVTPEWTDDSSKVVFTASPINDELNGEVFVVDADGENLLQLTKNVRTLPGFVRWSPNEEWLVVVLVTSTSKELAIVKSDGSDLKQLGVEWVTLGGPNVAPVWSPDSQEIAFLSNRIGEDKDWQIYIVNIKTQEISQLTNTSEKKDWLDWR